MVKVKGNEKAAATASINQRTLRRTVSLWIKTFEAQPLKHSGSW